MCCGRLVTRELLEQKPADFAVPPWPAPVGKDYKPEDPPECPGCGWVTKKKRTVGANGGIIERRVCTNSKCKDFSP
jgi:hypothetical protein